MNSQKSGILSAVAFALLGVLWIALSPSYVSRGPVKNIMLTFVGSTYGANVQCTKPVEKSLLEGFLGMGNGDRYFVKAYGRADAREAVESAFQGCSVSHVELIRR